MKIDDEQALMLRKNFWAMKCLNHDNIIKYKTMYLDKKKRKSFLIMQYTEWQHLQGKILSEDKVRKIIF
jgi:hypothetical protein